MKKPTSLYLNELQVNRVARRLEKALDGHGSLSGFFTWLEERAYAALMEGGEYKEDPSSQQAWDDYFRTIDLWHHQGEQEAMAAYRQAWERLAERLPWHRENPAASHVLALFALKDNRALWDRPRSVEEAGRDPLLAFAGWGADTDEIVRAFRARAQRSSVKQDDGGLLWLSNRLEKLYESRAKPVSFYFDERAHAMMLRAFQGTFFDRLLGVLDEMLSGWGYKVLELEPETRFLEHPMTFFQRWPLRIPNALTVEGRTLLELAETPEDRAWLVELLEPVHSQAEELKGENEEKLLFLGGELPWEVLAHIGERFGKERLCLALLEEFKDFNLVYMHNPSDLAFRLILRLNLINPRAPQDAPTPEQVLGAFMSRYGLSEIKPERRLMYRVLRQAIPLLDDKLTDPLQLHALGLLQAYALEVLPEDEREPERVSRTALGILGQTNLFPTRDTLEAWSGMRVRVEGPNRWRLFKGRKLWRELTDEQAFEAASLLSDIALPINGVEKNMPDPWRTQLSFRKDAPRVAYRLGAEPLERALEVLATPTPLEGEGPRVEWERKRHRIKLLSEELEKHAIPRGE